MGSHIDASHSRQPLVKGERLVRYEVNAVMLTDLRRGNNFQLDKIWKPLLGMKKAKMTSAGLEPAIPGSVGRCLIHWATRPSGNGCTQIHRASSVAVSYKPPMLVTRVRLPAGAFAKRHRGDSNPCGQSPMDFESISLAARTQCLESEVCDRTGI